MDASDRVLLVTNPDLASLHDTSRFVQISRTLAYPAGKLLVVLNRDNLMGGVRLRDIQAALHLLKLPARPTALLAINDLLAIGALRAASDLGLRVPADLSLVGYDDIPLASFLVPRLTTSSKDMVKVGREAARMLLARIREPDRPHQRVDIQARFIIRESTGPAPA